MQSGDLVRFALPGEINHHDRISTPLKNIGVLIEHDKILQRATILYKGILHSINHAYCQKAGKKDLESNKLLADKD